jgi:hypothetical protein
MGHELYEGIVSEGRCVDGVRDFCHHLSQRMAMSACLWYVHSCLQGALQTHTQHLSFVFYNIYKYIYIYTYICKHIYNIYVYNLYIYIYDVYIIYNIYIY